MWALFVGGLIGWVADDTGPWRRFCFAAGLALRIVIQQSGSLDRDGFCFVVSVEEGFGFGGVMGEWLD